MDFFVGVASTEHLQYIYVAMNAATTQKEKKAGDTPKSKNNYNVLAKKSTNAISNSEVGV